MSETVTAISATIVHRPYTTERKDSLLLLLTPRGHGDGDLAGPNIFNSAIPGAVEFADGKGGHLGRRARHVDLPIAVRRSE